MIALSLAYHMYICQLPFLQKYFNPFGTADEYICQADQLELTLYWD